MMRPRVSSLAEHFPRAFPTFISVPASVFSRTNHLSTANVGQNLPATTSGSPQETFESDVVVALASSP